jgi:hypothetical protein
MLIGIVVVALLWQLGVVPPDRLVLFGVLAATIALVTIMLTQRAVLVRKRFIVVMALCGLMAGVAVEGIPDAISAGSLSEGCSAEGTSSLDSKAPDQTSIADPLDVTKTDTLQWNAGSTEPLTNWRGALGMDVGGFQVMIWSASSASEDIPKSLSGSADVASYLGDLDGGTGVALAGMYHLYGSLDADQRTCDMSAYVRVHGEGAFAGTLNVALWIALGSLILVVVVMGGVVRHSITRSARAAVRGSAPESPTAERHAEEPARRAERAKRKRSGKRSRSPKEPDEAAPASREESGRDVRPWEDAFERSIAAQGEEPVPGQEPLQVHEPAQVHDEFVPSASDGGGLADSHQPEASTSAVDDADAPPTTDGEHKPPS